MKNKKTLLVVSAIILILICICLCILYAIGSNSKKATGHNTPAPITSTAAKTASPIPSTSTNIPSTGTNTPVSLPTSSSTPAPTPTLSQTDTPTAAAQAPFIPSVQPADVKVNLEQKNFTCNDVQSTEDNGVTYYSWTCSRDSAGIYYYVQFTGRTLLSLDTIEATITQATPDQSKSQDFLGYMATFGFIGSSADQQQARAWTESAIPTLSRKTGDSKSTTINNVDLLLYGPQTAVTLVIGNSK